LEDLAHRADLGRSPLGNAVKRTARVLLPSQRLRKEAFWLLRRRVIFGEPPPPDESLMLELRHRFTPEVQALAEYLDRDLVTLWGYDQLA